MKFIVHQFKDLDLTIHEATDPIDVNDIIAELENFYQDRVTTYLIWELKSGRSSSLSGNDIEEIINISKKYGSLRRNGKSAVVTKNDLFYGLSRVFENYAEMEPDLSIKVRVFKNIEDAMAWFGLEFPHSGALHK
jgi:hypothetical protein